MNSDDTIAALATPFGQAAVAIVRVSGPRAREIAKQVFDRADTLVPRVQTFGHIVDAKGQTIDDGLVTLFVAPASYTGEDLIEIGCHGGVLVSRRVLEATLTAGARIAEPGEFTQRAFLNGKLDLTQAEAVMDLIEARTDLALAAANRQLDGALGRKTMALRETLLGVLAHLEAWIDFPDEDIDPDSLEAINSRLVEVQSDTRGLLATADEGRILREGVATVICGAPNAGKSSLLNVLLGFDRAIVSPEAGTTRDTIEEVVNLRGIALRLVDTAGVRESDDQVERAGIDRTHRELEAADLILEVLDASGPRVEVDLPPAAARTAHLRILNKSDLPRHPDWEGEKEGLGVSCLTEEGTAELADAIHDAVTHGAAEWGTNLVAINARHRDCLRRADAALGKALAALQAGESPEFTSLEVRDALAAIGEVVGRVDSEELLGEIFASFCIGK